MLTGTEDSEMWVCAAARCGKPPLLVPCIMQLLLRLYPSTSQ
jgi:hypothetical protein